MIGLRLWWRKRASDVFELVAFLLVAAVCFHFWGVWPALVPVAVWAFLLSLALDRGKR